MRAATRKELRPPIGRRYVDRVLEGDISYMAPERKVLLTPELF
jgi:hypothetical protein